VLAYPIEVGWQLAINPLEHAFTEAYSFRLGDGLEPSGDVHAVTEDVPFCCTVTSPRLMQMRT